MFSESNMPNDSHTSDGRRSSRIIQELERLTSDDAQQRRSDDFLLLVLKAARAGTWIWDVPGDLHTRDARLNALLGLNAVETTKPIEEFFEHVHADDRETIRTAFDQSVRQGRPLSLEFRVVWPDGTVRWLRDQGDIFAEGTTSGAFMTGACIDVTDLKATEAELRESREKLAELNAALDERVREQTKELREREERLRGLAMQLTKVEQVERRRLAELLHDHVQQLLVASMMNVDVIRMTQPAERADWQLDDLKRLLDEALQATRTLAVELAPPVLHEQGLGPALHWLARRMHAQNKVLVHVKAQPNVNPGSEETREMMFQAARELLLNVAKHAATDTAWVELEQADSHVVLTIWDEGRGFDPEKSLKESESFGLFHVRERLLQGGGTMRIESSPGKGARVTIAVPVLTVDLPANLPASVSAAPAPVSAPQQLRVLVVDDHQIVRRGLSGLIAVADGMDLVAEAKDGQAAVELAQSLRPDVIVMDVNMPRMNGVEATRQIKALLPQIRIIGLSLHEQADLADAMLEAGADGYVAKNAPASDILRALRGESL
ncbi:MAG TPA: response regulator [Pirellulaceae bacterium]|jgi:PAS domain S-box-containing protein|nr:response regulator [Pirellulaceae bacterium]